MMTQIRAANNINPLNLNIEGPAVFIPRMSSPMSFMPLVTVAYDLEDQANAALVLSKSIKLKVSKAVINVVELKTFSKRLQAAQECKLVVFGLIKATQSQIVAPYIEGGSKPKYQMTEVRLSKVKDLLAKAYKSCPVILQSYQPLAPICEGEMPFLLK